MILNRRSLIYRSAALLAATQVDCFLPRVWAEDAAYAVAETSSGKVRGMVINGVNVFKGIPYGGTTAGKNRFMPPTPPEKWTGIRDALAWGPTAPQLPYGNPPPPPRPGTPEQSEDCLVLNVFTPELGNGKRPVMVWLHGGGFIHGSASVPGTDGTNLAHFHDVVVVSVNHRLNMMGATYLGEAAGPEFEASGGVGMLDLVAVLHWVRENIERFGGDPSRVMIFGQSGGGRKVATLLAMPSAKGLFHSAVVESGALLRLVSKDDAIKQTDLLMRVLGIPKDRARELQNVPLEKILLANAAVQKEVVLGEVGQSENSPVVDGAVIPGDPWDPAAPEISVDVPVMMGWARTEETAFDKPTPEKMAITELGMREMVAARLGVDPDPVVAAFKETFPDTSPWDLYILIASNHPRAAFTEEMGKRRAVQGKSPTWMYRVDWETPEGGGHMRSPHAVELPFVFNNVKIAGPLISKMPTAVALEDKMSSTWVEFARSGNPNNSKIPNWPTYSAQNRETMLFNDECKVQNDPQRVARIAMERVLKLA